MESFRPAGGPVDQFPLTPSQQQARDQILQATGAGATLVTLEAVDGLGRTTVLRDLAGVDAPMVAVSELMGRLLTDPGLAIEEAFLRLCLPVLYRAGKMLLIDDLQLLTNISEHFSYPRGRFLDLALRNLLEEAEQRGIPLVVGLGDEFPDLFVSRAHRVSLKEYTERDYQAYFACYLGAKGAVVEAGKVHRFASRLNGHQLRNACRWLAGESGEIDTARFIAHLRDLNLASNVEIAKVEEVTWSQLRGMDVLARELEAKIILPLENDALAAELQLRPKRGVLLVGPPGTGKTSVGKALAHRLKSKFFLLDGTFAADNGSFFQQAEALMEAARSNAPAIVFIDDADVIFENNSNTGFYRYLLTVLDGLEGASPSGRVSVMMTAMDALRLPSALLRSGRVDLWLETRLPDRKSRRQIAEDALRGFPESLCAQIDLEQIAGETHDFTAADLKSAIEDGKLLFAYEKGQRQSGDVTEEGPQRFFLEAIAKVKAKGRALKARSGGVTRSLPLGFTGGDYAE